MKKFFTMLVIVLCELTLFAQAPEKFTYQAVVRNASNQLISNAPVGVRVSILQGGVNGMMVYMETHTAVTNANGLVTLQIGGGNVQQGVFSNIDWVNGPFFLKTEMDPNGGSDYSVTSVQQLLSVPYALYAKEAGNGFSGDYNDLTNTPDIPTVPDSVSAFINDAGYLTSFTEQQILSISNDTIFLTGGSFVKLPAGFDGDYYSLTNQPTIPTTVGELTNDANYITLEQVPAQVNADWNATEGAAQILNKPELFSGDYNDLSNQPTIPTDVSAFTNDAGYITMDSVPTNISAFTNDASYLTGYTEIDPQFSAWDKNYNDLINTPEIPTVPSNVSTFVNDAGYITMDSVPTNVSAFNNDVGYLTGFIETQTLADVTAQGNSAGNRQLKNVSDPTDPQDAVTKAYLEQFVSNLTELIQDMQQHNDSVREAMQQQLDSLQNVVDALTGGSTTVTQPTVTTSAATNVTSTSATLNGNVSNPDNVAITAQGFEWKATANGTYTQVEASNTTMTYNLTGLTSNNSYIYRAFVTTTDGTTYGNEVSFTTLAVGDGVVVDEKSCPGTPTVTDHEGNVYATVYIGQQCWMRDNIRTTTSPSTGTYLIPAVGTTYTYTGKQARWYNNDSATYAPMNYGLLYNWNAAVDTFNAEYGETSVVTSSNFAVNTIFTGHRRGICPQGWHVPSNAEWTELASYVGSQDDFISEYDTYHDSTWIAKSLAFDSLWSASTSTCVIGNNISANNLTNFSALPAGISQRTSYTSGNSVYEFRYQSNHAFFWSSTQDGTSARNRYLIYDSPKLLSNYSDYGAGKGMGMSVRCLRDEVIDNPDNPNPTPPDTSVTLADTTILGIPCPGSPTVTDHEGNVYATVQIGNQCWMRDNLRTTTSPSTGTYLIPAADIYYTFTGKQAHWYNNDSATYAPMNYGLLYNWQAAVDTFNAAYGETSVNLSPYNALSVTFNGYRRGICPAGWHLPSVAEWTQLENYVRSQSEYICGGYSIAKALAFEAGWNSNGGECSPGDQSVMANNVTGFSALPSGQIHATSFGGLGGSAGFWSSSEINYDGVKYFFLDGDDETDVVLDAIAKNCGNSVRCLRD